MVPPVRHGTAKYERRYGRVPGRTGGTMNIPIDSTGLLIRPMEALILDMQAQRIPISGADRLDVEEARKRITLCFQLLGSLVETQMSKLNENLSYPIDINDIMAQMADAQSDLEGRLEATEDGLS